MRKIKKADLKAFQEKTGVRVEYSEKLPDLPAPQSQEVTLSVPEEMLKPLMDLIGKLLASHEQTQSMIAQALSNMTDAGIGGLDIIGRDSDGNISEVSFKRSARH